MSKFKVIGKANSKAVLPSNISDFKASLKSESYLIDIAIKNDVSSYDDSTITQGLLISGTIELTEDEDEIHKAIGIFTYETNKFLRKIAFVSAVPVGEFMITKCYCITEGLETRRILQYGYGLADSLAISELNPVNFDILIKTIENLDPKPYRRIERALNWYSKAISEENPLDRFTYIWIAFEALSSLFAIEFNVDEKSVCTNCGFERVQEGMGSTKYYFENVLNKGKLYSKARRLRHELQHSFEDVNKVTRNIIELEDDLMECLRKAITYLVGMKGSKVNHPHISNADELKLEVAFEISDYVGKMGDDFEPDIELSIDITKDSRGFTIKPIAKVNFLDRGIEIHSMSWNIYGNPGRHIIGQQLEIIG